MWLLVSRTGLPGTGLITKPVEGFTVVDLRVDQCEVDRIIQLQAEKEQIRLEQKSELKQKPNREQ